MKSSNSHYLDDVFRYVTTVTLSVDYSMPKTSSEQQACIFEKCYQCVFALKSGLSMLPFSSVKSVCLQCDVHECERVPMNLCTE